MSVQRRNWSRRARAAARPAAALAAGLLLALLASLAAPVRPAGAHAVLLESSPADGAILTEQPGEVVLRFSEPVDLPPDAIVVLDAGEARWDAGRAERVERDPRTARVAVRELPAGAFLVSWQVSSADGHAIRGTFTFGLDPPEVTEPEEPAAPDPEAPAAPAAPLFDDEALRALEARARAGAETSVGALAGISRFAAYGGTLLLVGGVVFLAALWPAGAASTTARRLAWAGWLAALLGGIGVLVLHGPAMIAGGLGDVFDPDLLSSTLDTRSGTVWALRLLLLAVAVPLLTSLGRRPVAELSPWWWCAAVAVGAGLVTVPALAGHAVTGRWVGLAVPAHAVHTAAAAVWLGGLALLCVSALRESSGDEAPRVALRFSNVAIAAIAIVVLTGLFQSWRQLEALDDLTGTTYGRLLLAKLAVFALVLAAAAASNRKVRAVAHETRPATERAQPLAVGAAVSGTVGAAAPPTAHLASLRRTTAVEIALAVIVVAVTAALVNAAPARSEAALPLERTIVTDELTVELAVIPARTGANELHFYVFDPAGAPLPLDAFSATLALPAEGIGPVEVPMSPLPIGIGHYMARGAEVDQPGTWRLEVTAILVTGDEVRAATDVPVRG